VSEPVQTLWFEEMSFLHEQMLDTPVGRFSIRQMIVFLLFGLSAYGASLFLEDLAAKIVVAGSIFFSGAAIFTRKTKTLPPEKHLLYIINNKYAQKKKHKKRKKHRQQKQKQKQQQKPPIPVASVKEMRLSATLGVPVKIVGSLKDLASKKVLINRSFELCVDGTTYSKGFTDQEGLFSAYFVPDHYGTFKLEIKPEDYAKPILQIVVKVNPKEVSQTA